MKARIVQVTHSGCWYAEVYGMDKWGYRNNTWNRVTVGCMTRIGAKLALRSWKQKYVPDEFEI